MVDRRPTILSVCDRPGQSELLGQTLRAAGYAWRGTSSVIGAARQVADGSVDAVVVDLRDTVPSGTTLCQAVRAYRLPVPILALVDRAAVPATADSTANSRVAPAVSSVVDYLDAGADDCLCRPFARAEFVARVRALLRRARQPHRITPRVTRAATLVVGDVWLDPVTHQAGCGSRPIALTRTEFTLLETFLSRPGHVLSAELLLRLVWGSGRGEDGDPPTRNTVAVYVGYLRRKLEVDDESQLLHTVRGVGYVLRAARTPSRTTSHTASRPA